MLRVQLLIVKEVSFKKRHFVLAVKRRLRTAPQIQHKVPRVILFNSVGAEISLICYLVKLVEQLSAAVLRAVYPQTLQPTFLVERYTAVKQNVPVADLVHRAVSVEKAYMTVQLLAVTEGSGQHGHKLLLALGQLQRVGSVHRREARVLQPVCFAVYLYSAVFKIHLPEHYSPAHFPFGVLLHELPFKL